MHLYMCVYFILFFICAERFVLIKVQTLLLTGRPFQLAKLAQQAEQHQFQMRFFIEPKVSNYATLKHINVAQHFLTTHSFSISFHPRLLLRELLYLPLQGSYVRGMSYLSCQWHASPWLIVAVHSVFTLLVSAGMYTWRTTILLGFAGGYVLVWNG